MIYTVVLLRTPMMPGSEDSKSIMRTASCPSVSGHGVYTARCKELSYRTRTPEKLDLILYERILNQMGDRFILFDGHRLLSASKTMEMQKSGMTQNASIQATDQRDLSVYPRRKHRVPYTEAVHRSTLDISAYTDILKESGGLNGNGNVVTVVTDKGFASSESFEILEDSGSNTSNRSSAEISMSAERFRPLHRIMMICQLSQPGCAVQKDIQ